MGRGTNANHHGFRRSKLVMCLASSGIGWQAGTNDEEIRPIQMVPTTYSFLVIRIDILPSVSQENTYIQTHALEEIWQAWACSP